jgi:PAS domain S-box-containing protein
LSQERHLQRINHRLSAISRVNQAILRTRADKQQLFVEACRIIHKELAYCSVWLGELLAEGQIQTQACESSVDGQTPHALDAAITTRSVHIARSAALTQQPVIEHHPPESSGSTKADLVFAAFPTPLSYSDITRPTLVLVVAASATEVLDSDELQILQELNGDLGLAVDSIAAEERSQRAEEALRISEDRFRRLAEHSLVGIVLIQNDLYRYVNPAFVRMFGYTAPNEIIDRLGPLDLAAPESREIVAANVAKRVSGQVRATRYQYLGLRKDGTYVEIEEHGARTMHAQRLAVIATVMDVTTREASRRRLEALSRAGLALAQAQTPQQALERASEQVAKIWPCAAVAILLFDQRTLTVAVELTTGEITDTVSARIQAGATVSDLALIRRILETRDAVIIDANHPSAPAWESSESDPPTAHAAPARRAAGVPLIVRGELIGFIVVEAPVDRQLLDQDAQHLRLFADHVAATYQHLHLISHLEEERNRLRTLNLLSHTLSETLMLQEVAERAVQQTRQALEADITLLYLWDEDAEILNAVAADGLPPAALSKLNRKLRDNPRTPWTDWMVPRQTFMGPGGPYHSPHWAYVQGMTPAITYTFDQPLESRGETIGFISSSRRMPRRFEEADATLISTLSVPIALALQNARFYEWISHQAELTSEALRRQEELDRMKDELIQNISHELRTPLALVMGYAEMLDTGQLGPIAPEQADAIAVIARRSRMLRSLVEDIALLWNVDRRVETKESLDLCETVATAIDEFAGQACERNLALHGECPEQPVIIAGVAIHIRRVLDNLVGNSMKFTPPGGQIVVRLWTENDWAVLSIADTGIGVPLDKLQRIFERFYQVDGSAKRRYGGTGLGLALVKAIVEAHSGTIRAMSPITEDHERPGMEVTVRLPLLSAPRRGNGAGHDHTATLRKKKTAG